MSLNFNNHFKINVSDRNFTQSCQHFVLNELKLVTDINFDF